MRIKGIDEKTVIVPEIKAKIPSIRSPEEILKNYLNKLNPDREDFQKVCKIDYYGPQLIVTDAKSMLIATVNYEKLNGYPECPYKGSVQMILEDFHEASTVAEVNLLPIYTQVRSIIRAVKRIDMFAPAIQFYDESDRPMGPLFNPEPLALLLKHALSISQGIFRMKIVSGLNLWFGNLDLKAGIAPYAKDNSFPYVFAVKIKDISKGC